MPTQAERSSAMRGRLIEVGSALFAERGYDATPASTLLREAGASKGALYHHFSSKRALFEAIFEQVAEASITRALARTPSDRGASQIDLLIEGALRWLDEASQPAVSRILLEDGPRVLGFARARDLEAKYSLGLMVRGLERAAEAGEIALPDVELAARLINAVLAEAALISLQQRDGANRRQVDATIRILIEGLSVRTPDNG
jgi:AcrR family transcriptional regulator